ncbi:hypothetical protein JW992_10505 [candidate division KSB1 bacterium]|nr:hypothetical protein [candidate division KSB1 bacterium]
MHILVDAGGFSRGIGEISRLKTDYLVRGLSELGYRVINLSTKDLTNGVELFHSLQDRYGVPFVSANIRRAGEKKSVFSPYHIVKLEAQKPRKGQIKDLRVGFLGLTEGRIILSAEIDEPELQVADPLETAQALVPELKKKCDLVVLLYYGNYGTVEQILNGVEGIDAVLMGGDYSRARSRAALERQPPVAAGLSLGKYLDVLTLTLNKKKAVQFAERRQIALKEDIADDPNYLRLVDEYEQAARDLTNRSESRSRVERDKQ